LVRLFAAVLPDDATGQRLASLKLRSDGLRLVASGSWHVTVRFFGEVDDDRVSVLVDALETAAAHLSGPLQCELGPKTAWFGDRVLQIPAWGLDGSAAAVRSATLPVVPDTISGEPTFNGHLTVARSRGRRLDQTVKAAVAGIPFAAAFEVESFDLVASQRTADGHAYTTLARVPLAG
jgi:2'-5' RNA ligase